jgi:hypothetical protein
MSYGSTPFTVTMLQCSVVRTRTHDLAGRDANLEAATCWLFTDLSLGLSDMRYYGKRCIEHECPSNPRRGYNTPLVVYTRMKRPNLLADCLGSGRQPARPLPKWLARFPAYIRTWHRSLHQQPVDATLNDSIWLHALHMKLAM